MSEASENTLLTSVEKIGDSDESINKIVVVPERVRLTSISDMITTNELRYTVVQVPAKVIGGTRKNYQVATPQGWFRKPLITNISQSTYAVRKKDGSTLLVDEDDLVFVYDESVWDSDSDGSKSKVNTKRKGAKVIAKS